MKTLTMTTTLGMFLLSGCAMEVGNNPTFGMSQQLPHLSGSTLWLPRQ